MKVLESGNEIAENRRKKKFVVFRGEQRKARNINNTKRRPSLHDHVGPDDVASAASAAVEAEAATAASAAQRRLCRKSSMPVSESVVRQWAQKKLAPASGAAASSPSSPNSQENGNQKRCFFSIS